MGEVYLAQDMTLGRRVALKMIKRSALAPGVLEQFLAEARTTAQFNHPNIVTLHAVGDHEGRPFLALEYVDGESLRARLGKGTLSAREALRVCRGIADAIAEAHRAGLVHADLKPENVVVARDGRIRVVDFGLARLVGGANGAASGTPAYMAPERWRGLPPTGAIDVWALGLMLHEMIVGTRPYAPEEVAAFAFRGAASPALPDASWAPLVRDCLALEPERRPSADEVCRRIQILLDPHARIGDGASCPFPGLAAFSREDAMFYYGRRAELDAIAEQLQWCALVPIIGPSGAGKSSFVRAALMPRLEDSARWTFAVCRPGSSPFDNLAAALSQDARTAATLSAQLRDQPDSLALVLGDRAARRDARMLLFIDQFEETFTLARDPDDPVRFCECLARAAHVDERWRIVLTLRDDFLACLARSPAMRAQLGAVTVLGPLSRSDLRAAVLGPLASVEYDVDRAELVARIVDDVEGQPACLPLLQFACQALWERRDRQARRICLSDYEAIGGATGALARHAQRLIDELNPGEVRIARAILLALVNPDGTRRPRTQHELLDGAPPETAGVIDRLLERRLVVASRDAEHDGARIEVAHEALATTWPQLARWLEETYEQRALLAELEQASLLWRRRGGHDDETWSGPALEDAVRRIDSWNISLSTQAREFLAAGVRRARRARGRRRWIFGGGAGALGAAAIAATLAALAFARKEEQAIAQQAQIRLAAADMGIVELRLEPFDWDPVTQSERPPAAPPRLAWQLRAPDHDDPHVPGRAFASSDLTRGSPVWMAGVLVEIIEARSGPAFLEVSRGDCAVSRLYLRRLPGFTERASPPRRIALRIPTCQASASTSVAIPAGEFIRNVAPTGKTGRDEPAWLQTFWIDRTEVTRAAFEIYAALEQLTGDAAVPADHLALPPETSRATPIVGVTQAVAASYCAFLGKELPTTDEWQKAFRGGISIDGAPNLEPGRATPWRVATSARPANIDGRVPEPVASYPDDVSPYGVHDLAGNVAEWTSSPAELKGLRMVLGGSWSVPVAERSERIDWRNSRADADLAYDIGLRCVTRAAR